MKKKKSRNFPYREMGYWVLILKVKEFMVFEVEELGITVKKAQSYIHNFTYLGNHRYRSRIIEGDKLLVQRIQDIETNTDTEAPPK